MVKLDVDISLEDIDIKKELKGYAISGFRWQRTGFPEGKDIRIWTPNYFMEDSDLIYFLDNTRLEFGNKRHIEMLQAGELMALLMKCSEIKYWDSVYFS
ncbi:hypothetical protein HYT92_01400 [Candidatus Pacearchaeota archaeon]|nr:hypothetical protein [Candidatus Pacearchaeota archaeon]